MKFFNFLLLVLFCISCGTQKIIIHVDKWQPYCGGARPTDEQAKGEKTSFSNAKFKLHFMEKSALDFMITLDENGNWRGKIAKNLSCHMFRLDKTIIIEDLYKKYPSDLGMFYTKIEQVELILWQSQADFIFKSNESKSFDFEVRENCFVGLNPCFRYIGPKPE